jgi:hypothetical protein
MGAINIAERAIIGASLFGFILSILLLVGIVSRRTECLSE